MIIRTTTYYDKHPGRKKTNQHLDAFVRHPLFPSFLLDPLRQGRIAEDGIPHEGKAGNGVVEKAGDRG